MFVSPAEPSPFYVLGPRSALCEKHGVDFLWALPSTAEGNRDGSAGRWAGVQRKEVKDLLASAQDGRLAKELAQMQGLALRAFVIEGKVVVLPDGAIDVGQFNGTRGGNGSRWTIQQYRGLLWSIQSRGCWVGFTGRQAETIEYLKQLQEWSQKESHDSLKRRPGPITVWGKANHRDYQLHLLQGLEGIGSELAERIVDHFGRVPWRWDVTKEELAQVKGIGKKKVETIWKALL